MAIGGGELMFALSILATIFWICMLIECAVREPDYGNTKIVWVIIIAATHIVGAVLYFFIRRPQRIAETGR